MLLAAVVATSVAAALLEGLGNAFILPLLQASAGTREAPPGLRPLLSLFQHVSVDRRILLAALILVGVTVLKGSALYGNIRSSCRLQIRVVRHFRLACFREMMGMGFGYLNREKTGRIQTVFSDYAMALGALANTVAAGLPVLFNVIVLAVLLALLSWKMLVFSLIVMGLLMMGMSRLMGRVWRAGRAYTLALAAFNSRVVELIRAVKTIRLFNQERRAAEEFTAEVERFSTALMERTVVTGMMRPIFETMSVLCAAGILIGGFHLLGRGSLAVLVTFLVVYYRLAQQAMVLNRLRVDIHACLPQVDQMAAFLDRSDKQTLLNGTERIEAFREAIVFDAVSFRYGEDPVLKQVSFRIPRGRRVAVVGPSGAGKSTLIELLLRFYDPQEGRILIDGKDLRSMDVESWRRLVGVVPQDIFLFHDTIRANIAFANPEADPETVERAARRARADEFIRRLPQGYETVVGDRGVLLSGGQRQRLAIARALLLDPPILVFDEATSALDAESEHAVHTAIREVSRDRTVLLVAHRLATVKDADTIVVLDGGGVTQEGSHEALMQERGVYHTLVRLQTLTPQEAR